VKTGDLTGAGTNANVSICIFGDNGDTGDIPLKVSDEKKDPFEKGHLDTFSVQSKTLVRLRKSKLGMMTRE